MWKLRAAAVQMCSTSDLTANLTACERLISAAAGQAAQLIVLPENFAYLGPDEGRPREVIGDASAQDGLIASFLRKMARTSGAHIIAGGLPEMADGPRAYNTALVVAPNGDFVAKYQKIHLFDIAIPGQVVLRESAHTEKGAKAVSASIGGATVGLSICYDLRFPELYRILRLDHGADIIVVPAAFTAHTGAAHWHTLLRARAIENQVYVVAAAQWGQHNSARRSFGHAVIFDPWGELLAEAPDADGVIIADCDSERLATIRAQLPCGQHVSVR